MHNLQETVEWHETVDALLKGISVAVWRDLYRF